MDLKEMALLQGFNIGDLSIPAGTSNKQMAACIGNMMSVNVMSKIMVRALYVARLITTKTYKQLKGIA